MFMCAHDSTPLSNSLISTSDIISKQFVVDCGLFVRAPLLIFTNRTVHKQNGRFTSNGDVHEQIQNHSKTTARRRHRHSGCSVRVNSFMRFNSLGHSGEGEARQMEYKEDKSLNAVTVLRCSGHPSSIAPSFTICLALSHLYDTQSLFIPLSIHYPCHFILPFLCPKAWAPIACHRWYRLSGLLGISWGIYGQTSPHKGYNVRSLIQRQTALFRGLHVIGYHYFNEA